MTLFDNTTDPIQTDCWYFWPHFFNKDEANALYTQLEAELEWQQGHIKIFGRTVAEPRLSAWYGDAGKSYTYSGKKQDPLAWHPSLWALKERLSRLTPAPPSVSLRFNSVLANYYRNGQDSMGWHSDDEPELGPQPVIASVNLGETRRFLWRQKADKSIKQEIALTHGSVLLMFGNSQTLWQHAIPKAPKKDKGRINLTFRWIY